MSGSTRYETERSTRVLLVECAAVALVVFVANAASRPPAVATLRRLYDDVVYLSVGKSMAEGLGLDAAWLGDVPGPRQAPNANCRVGRTGNGNLGSGTIGDGNFARAGLTLGVRRALPCLRELAR